MQPMVHEHVTRTDGQGREICQTCGEAVIKPILDFDDPRLQNPPSVSEPHTPAMWVDAINSIVAIEGGANLDFMLIELTDRLGMDRPPYIDILSEHYAGEEPPHVDDERLD